MANKPGTAENLMQCPIWSGDFTDPRISPCLHTVCRGCLEKGVSASEQRDTLSCPSCRHKGQILDEGLSAVPESLFLASSRKNLEQQSRRSSGGAASCQAMTDSEQNPCDSAKREPLTHEELASFSRPTDCEKLHCGACGSYHIKKSAPTPTDKVTAVATADAKARDDSREQRSVSHCKQHSDMKLDLYCDTCQTAVCTKCCTGVCKKHKHRDIKTVAESCQNALTEMSTTAAGHVTTLDRHIKKLDASQTDIERDAKNACQEVRKAAEELRDLVRKREQYLIQQIQRNKKSALLEVKAFCKETELNKARMQTLQSDIQDLQELGSVTDQVAETPGLQEQLHQQQREPLKAVSWTTSFKEKTSSVSLVDAMLGTVSTDRSVVVSKVATAGDGTLNQVRMTLESPLCTIKPNLNFYVSGLVALRNCVCAISTGHSQLWIHNTVTNASELHSLQGLAAVGMTALQEDTRPTLVITDSNKKLHFVTFNQETGYIINRTIQNITFAPWHISVHPVTGHLVIADITNNAIVTCDTKGNVQRSIKVQARVGSMVCAVGTVDGYVILDYCSKGRVHWVDGQGRVTDTYGQKDGQVLSYPWHMVRDSQGQLLIADGDNNRLHLVNTRGKLSCYLLKKDDGIKALRCVWLEETTSLLYVAHGLIPEVRVYKWPPNNCKQHTLQIKLIRYK